MATGVQDNGTVGRTRAAWASVLLLWLLTAVAPEAQTVVDVLLRQRRDARVREVIDEIGPRVPPRDAHVGEVSDPIIEAYLAVQARRQSVRDSLVRAQEVAADSTILAAQLATLRWRKVEPGAQGAFLDQYREAYWQAARPRGLAIDTMGTPELRGRLQAAFGRPTRNADAQQRYGYGGSEYVQFEYWFVVNDSIPVLALDLDGPFGEGLLVAGDEVHADLLDDLKRDLAGEILAVRRPDPWVDYYHAYDRETWYRTGYNGTDYFTVPVRTPRWSGRTVPDRWIIHR